MATSSWNVWNINEKFRTKHNETKAIKCKHKENDSRLKQQFIYGINNEDMTAEIIKELMAIKDTAKVKMNKYLYGPKGDQGQHWKA